MKKLQKILFAVSLSTMGAFICFPIYAGTWSHDSNGWSYQSDDGNSPRGTWKKMDIWRLAGYSTKRSGIIVI